MRKKLLLSLIIAAYLLASSTAFASVGFKKDGTTNGTATDINVRNAGTSVTNDGSTVTFNLMLAGTQLSGTVSMASGTTAVDPAYAFVRKHIATLAQAGTLANGKPGQLLTVLISQETGTSSFVITPTTKVGYTSVTLDDAGDLVTFLYLDDTNGWVIVSGNSLTVTP